MGVIVYNGVSSEELGIVVETAPNYEIAERDYDVISVPGKNGDYVIDRGCFKNVDRVYSIAFAETVGDFAGSATLIAEWLYSGYGYKRLEDSYEPDYFVMARVSDGHTIHNILQQAGRAEITFNRKPQRYLKIGEYTTKINVDGGRIINPTSFDSDPLIKVFGSGSGTISIGNKTIQISNISDGLTIDCEMQEVYLGSTSYNQNVNYMYDGFPKLKPGRNIINFSGGVNRVEIIPRWWTV